MGKNDRVPLASAPPLNTPFAGLAGKTAPAAPASPSASPVGAKSPPARAQPIARAVVRYERKGHGGKDMTRIEKLGLSSTELSKWLKEAKNAFGCGGSIDGSDLLLQGDHRERLGVWLEKRGVAKVTVS